MDIRVMVASEVRLYREGLQRVLQGIAGIALVGIASCAEEVLVQAAALVPTVILLDIAMARSLSVAKHFSRSRVNGGVVILGIPEGGTDVIRALPEGILGYVTRDGTVADLLDAIHTAGRGEVYTSPRVVPLARERGNAGASSGASRAEIIEGLTAREMEILKLMQRGSSNKTISRELGIGLSTVKNHVHNVLVKL